LLFSSLVEDLHLGYIYELGKPALETIQHGFAKDYAVLSVDQQ
jgi:hypothetical protein